MASVGIAIPDAISQILGALSCNLNACWTEVSAIKQYIGSISLTQDRLRKDHDALREDFEKLCSIVLPTSGPGGTHFRSGYGHVDQGSAAISSQAGFEAAKCGAGKQRLMPLMHLLPPVGTPCGQQQHGMQAPPQMSLVASSSQVLPDKAGSALSGCKSAIYVVGGTFSDSDAEAASSVEFFNVVANRFDELPQLTAPHGAYCASAVAAGKLYIFGGGTSSETFCTCSRFDPDGNVWELLAPMPTARRGCTAVNVAGSIYVCGGHDGQKDLDTVEKLDPRSGAWHTASKMSTARAYFTAATAELMPYMIGGFKTREQYPLKVCERLGRRGQWEAVAPMTTPRWGAAAATARGTVFVYGGHDGRDILRSGEGYDPQAESWAVLPPLPAPRTNCTMVSVSTSLYIFGGHDSSGALSSAMRLDASDQPWKPLPDMLFKRGWCDGASWSRGLGAAKA